MKKSVRAITKRSLDEVCEQKSCTNWARVRSMNDAELTANAQSDAATLFLDEYFFDKATRLGSVLVAKKSTIKKLLE